MIKETLQWGEPKGLRDPKNKLAQLAKLMEEVGELAAAILRDDKDEQEDAIGDIEVVLTLLADQLGFDKDECFKKAYNVIKDRKGTTSEDGSFIKK